MSLEVTNENLIVVFGGHQTAANLGHQRHLPIFKDVDGTEYVSLDGQTFRKIADLDQINTRRETVQR